MLFAKIIKSQQTTDNGLQIFFAMSFNPWFLSRDVSRIWFEDHLLKKT